MRDLSEHETTLIEHIERLETERYLALREGCSSAGDPRDVPKRLRFEILRRDKFACQYCGVGAPHARLHVDHVVPVVRGGTSAPSNLLTACEACNSGKHTAEVGASAPPPVNTLDRYGEADDALRLAKLEWRRAGFDPRAIAYLLAIRAHPVGSDARALAVWKYEAFLEEV